MSFHYGSLLSISVFDFPRPISDLMHGFPRNAPRDILVAKVPNILFAVYFAQRHAFGIGGLECGLETFLCTIIPW